MRKQRSKRFLEYATRFGNGGASVTTFGEGLQRSFSFLTVKVLSREAVYFINI